MAVIVMRKISITKVPSKYVMNREIGSSKSPNLSTTNSNPSMMSSKTKTIEDTKTSAASV